MNQYTCILKSQAPFQEVDTLYAVQLGRSTSSQILSNGIWFYWLDLLFYIATVRSVGKNKPDIKCNTGNPDSTKNKLWIFSYKKLFKSPDPIHENVHSAMFPSISSYFIWSIFILHPLNYVNGGIRHPYRSQSLVMGVPKLKVFAPFLHISPESVDQSYWSVILGVPSRH